MQNSRQTEATLADLYQSTVNAFPLTTRRQHSTSTIRITELRWVPFLGMRTLFLKAHAQNFLGEGGEYQPVILFKGVQYHNQPAEGLVEFTADDGQVYRVEPLHRDLHSTLVRCQCLDFKFRFKYYDSVDHSLYGNVGKPYVRVPGSNRPPANPLQLPGVCKHLLSMEQMLRDSGLLI